MLIWSYVRPRRTASSRMRWSCAIAEFGETPLAVHHVEWYVSTVPSVDSTMPRRYSSTARGISNGKSSNLSSVSLLTAS
eukprot:13661267-Heterocapsa_arctica.AAC.1